MEDALISLNNLRLAAHAKAIKLVVIERVGDRHVLKAQLQAIDHLFTVKGTRGGVRTWKSVDKLLVTLATLWHGESEKPCIELRL